ncbi:MAG: hypothetical protein AAGD25_35450 [Cyanobacteria bacterium P01_F01_bin.150]
MQTKPPRNHRHSLVECDRVSSSRGFGSEPSGRELWGRSQLCLYAQVVLWLA